jgi:hypothetical protein
MGTNAGIPIVTPANISPEFTPRAANGTTVPPRPCILCLTRSHGSCHFFKAQNICHAVKSPICIGNGPPPAAACHMEKGVFVQHSNISRQHAWTHFLIQASKVLAGFEVTAMSRSLSAKSLKVRRSGSDEDSKAIKMLVP